MMKAIIPGVIPTSMIQIPADLFDSDLSKLGYDFDSDTFYERFWLQHCLFCDSDRIISIEILYQQICSLQLQLGLQVLLCYTKY